MWYRGGMYEAFKKHWRKVAGVFCITLGLFALVTPLTPGSWLVFVGAEMLGIGFLSRDNVFRHLNRLKEWWSKSKENTSFSPEQKK